jgi:protein O-GlcNAc transferase
MRQRASPLAQRDCRPVFESLEEAISCHQRGLLPEAERLYQIVLEVDDRHLGSIHGLGLIRLQEGRFADAAALFRRASKINRNSAETHHHLGVALTGLRKPQEAIERFEKALAIRLDFAEAHDSLGHALQMLGRSEAAIVHHEKALAIKPSYAEARNNLGNALLRLGQSEKAIAQYEKALALRPNYPEACNNLGRALATLGRHDEAVTHYRWALALRPDYVDACINFGNGLAALARQEEALAQYERALTISPNHVEALNKRGNMLSALKRDDEALVSFEKALSVESGNPYAFNGLARSALFACDWARSAKLSRQLTIQVAQGKLAINPFTFLGCCGDPSLQLACAKAFVRHEIHALPTPLWKGAVWRNEKIRIGYLSAGFRRHPNAYLTAELFELHDRSRFDVLGFSLGTDDRSDIRGRLVRAFDRFHDVHSKSDREIATLMHEMQVDIVIDRSGYVTNARPGILAYRPAPIQVNYLGFPGTLGADFYDYVIADPIVLPFDQQEFYTEQIVHLPDCYQSNDRKRAIAVETGTRQEMGLPARGFVFCCFNNNYKITPAVFDVWMRMLRQVEGSVLWLLRDSVPAENNLRKEAAAREVDPARLVFAGRMGLEEHLARHRLADLFLDTLPFTAHTTASDALWSGLPLLTCRGGCFAGRVAASLLTAIGLPELVTDSLDTYEALALRLATEPNLLRGFRERLEQNRRVYPLFDTDRYRHHIEAAYSQMWEIWQRGERPRSFAVKPFPSGMPKDDPCGVETC